MILKCVLPSSPYTLYSTRNVRRESFAILDFFGTKTTMNSENTNQALAPLGPSEPGTSLTAVRGNWCEGVNLSSGPSMIAESTNNGVAGDNLFQKV